MRGRRKVERQLHITFYLLDTSQDQLSVVMLFAVLINKANAARFSQGETDDARQPASVSDDRAVPLLDYLLVIQPLLATGHLEVWARLLLRVIELLALNNIL